MGNVGIVGNDLEGYRAKAAKGSCESRRATLSVLAVCASKRNYSLSSSNVRTDVKGVGERRI